jgi:phosphoribosylanthranilate isomerase
LLDTRYRVESEGGNGLVGTTRVKICGLIHAADAEMAVEAGADALGFNFERSSRRFIGDGELPWLSVLPPFPVKVAVFGRVDRVVPKGLFDVVQGVEWDVFPEPSPKRIHVVRLREGQRAQDLMDTVIAASMVLLDTYSENMFGGTGLRVDWDLAAEIVRLSKLPVMLAGGLTPDNVAEAIRIVRPFAVDVSSGVEERPGVKDAIKVRDFIQAAKAAL